MQSSAQPMDPVKVPGYLELMLELDALKQDHQFRPRRAFEFAWLLFGFVLGGWLVLQWA